jgi:hypothetical protein
MVGRTLTEIRDRLERLASDGGRYYVRCGRTGERPVPVDGLAFPDRETAVEAVRAAHAYRAALRRYDPRAPWYDFVVCEREGEGAGSCPVDCGREWAFPRGGRRSNGRALVAYCHDVAGAVFEALSVGEYGDLERTVMDAYLESAEETGDRDRLCLALLATMATELDDLSLDAQREVLERTTGFLPAVSASESPVADALAALRANAVVGEYAVEGSPPRHVAVDGYELPAVEGRLPTLPVTVEAARRARGPAPLVESARRRGDGRWLLSIATRGPSVTCSPVRTDA